MASTYYLPQTLFGFQSWNNNFATQISASPAAYGLTVGDASAHSALTSQFNDDLLNSTTPETRTPVSVATTQIAFEQCRESAQGLVQKYQAAGAPDALKSAILNVTFRDDTKTPILAPTAVPDLAIQKIEPQRVILRIKVAGVIGNALPLGSIGYEVWMAVGLTNPPNSPTAMLFAKNGSRRFATIEFATADIGKNVSFAVRYRTAKNLTGPWSSIITCTVSAG